MGEPKYYPGNWVAQEMVEGRMSNHRQQVEAIARDIGSSVMPDNAQWVNRFTVNSTSSKATYTVSQRRSDGTWGCSCRGWTTHRRCKHLTDILRRLATVQTLASLAKTPAQTELSSSVVTMLNSARDAFTLLGGIK